MRFFPISILLTAILFAGAATAAGSSDPCAIVKFAAGDCVIIRGEITRPAATGAWIFKGDRVQTAATGKIGLIFEDDTVVSVGPNSQIDIEDFLFQPAEKKLSFVARMFQGTLSLLTGQIARLAPTQFRLETPDATIGFRGTRILVKVG